MKHFFEAVRHYLLAATIILVLCLGTVYYFYWHWRPFTQNAFLFANTRPVSPMVSGYITEIHVKNNQYVKKGDPLFTTFQPPYILRVAELKNEIQSKTADLRSLEERIKVGESDIVRFKAELANNQYLSDRADLMYRGDAVSQTYAEERLRAKQVSEAQIAGAVHSVEALKHDCDSTRALIAMLKNQLELAEIWAYMTVVRALDDGYVTNMSISPGGCYSPGDVLFGFVDTSTWWVQANFKESELSHIKPGIRARIWLWQYPGREFKGVVEAVGWSAERRRSAESGLPVVEKENEWFLLPQRFPVQIRVLDPDPEYPFHVGGSAYVELDTYARPVRQFFWELFLWW